MSMATMPGVAPWTSQSAMNWFAVRDGRMPTVEAANSASPSVFEDLHPKRSEMGAHTIRPALSLNLTESSIR